MTMKSQNNPIDLSKFNIDFGLITPGQTVIDDIMLVNNTNSSISLNYQWDQPWLMLRPENQSNNSLKLVLEVDISKITKVGPQVCNLIISCLNQTEKVKISLNYNPGKTAISKPAVSVTPSITTGISQTPNITANPLHLKSLGPMRVLSILVNIVNIILFSFALYLLSYAIVRPFNTKDMNLIINLMYVLYLLIAFKDVIFPNKNLISQMTDPQMQNLYQVYVNFCQKISVYPPRLYFVQSNEVNLFSKGISPQFSSFFVTSGLIGNVTQMDDFEAILAHEISHLKRLDTAYLTLISPVLGLISSIMAFFTQLFISLGRLKQGSSGMMPLLYFLMPRGGGGKPEDKIIGFFVALIVIMVIIYLMTMVFSIIIWAIITLIFSYIYFMSITRNMEKNADLDAASMLNDGDKIINALLLTSQINPSEKSIMDIYARNILGLSNYKPYDIVKSLKAGNNPGYGMGWREKMYRSHQLINQRIANIIKYYGTNIA